MGVYWAKDVLKSFSNISIEIIDLRSIKPLDFKKIEKLSNDLKSYFNTLLETKLFDEYKIQDLKSSLKKSLDSDEADSEEGEKDADSGKADSKSSSK